MNDDIPTYDQRPCLLAGEHKISQRHPRSECAAEWQKPASDLPNGTVADLGREVYVCEAHDRRVFVAQGDGPNYSAGSLVHFAGDGSVCLAAADEAETEHAFLFRIPLWVHVKDGKIVRVVADDNFPTRDEKPLAVVRDASEGWAPSDHRTPTEDEVAEWETVRKGDWPAWDFSWV